MDNLWGISSRKVYDNRKEYDDKEHLWYAVKDCWREISNSELCMRLIISMSNRCVDVLQSSGNICKYDKS